MLLGSSGSSGNISLGVRFYLKDQFTGPVKKMQDALQGYKQEFQAFQDNLRAARNVALAVAGAGMMATRGMYQAAMEGAEFLYIMKGVEAITEATNGQMENLKTLAIGLGRETMFMPEDIASGMRFMAMAGQDALTIQETMTAATNLAGATMTQLGGKMGAADIMTNALKAFGWEAKRSAEMSDVLTAATTNANVSLTDLGNSIRYVAATSRNLQIPVQETVGLLMSLGNAGIQSSMAGTALENMYRYLARSLTGNASKKAREAWESMGLGRGDVTTSTGHFKPMVEILGMMNKAMAGMDPIETQAIFRNIFGVRGVRGAATIARNLEQAGGFVEMLSDQGKIGGTAAKKMAIMMDNLQGVSLQLISTWKGLKVAWADAVGHGLMPLMRVLKKVLSLVTDFIKTPVGKVLSNIVFGITAVVTVVFTLRAALLSVAYAVKTLTVSWQGMGAASSLAMGFLGVRGGAGLAGVGAAQAAMYNRTGAMPSNYTGTQAPFKPPTTIFSSRGGSQRVRGPGGRIVGNPIVPGPLSYHASVLTRSTKAVRGLGGVMRGVLGFGRGLLGFLGGPVGLGIMALSIIGPWLPDIWSALVGNTKAMEANTRVLSSTDKALNSELVAGISQFSLAESQRRFKENIVQAILQGYLTVAEAQEQMEGPNKDNFIMSVILEQTGEVGTTPLTGGSTGRLYMNRP